MRLINVLLPAIFCAWSTFISAASQLGTGLVNENNICYMNALLSCLYDVTPFRKVQIRLSSIIGLMFLSFSLLGGIRTL